MGDIYPRGDCIESTTCDNVNGTYTLVSVPATSKCSSAENCKPNSSGEYECIKIPGKKKSKIIHQRVPRVQISIISIP